MEGPALYFIKGLAQLKMQSKVFEVKLISSNSSIWKIKNEKECNWKENHLNVSQGNFLSYLSMRIND